MHHSEDWYVANYNMADQDSFMAARRGSLDSYHPKLYNLTKKDIKDMGLYQFNIRECLK